MKCDQLYRALDDPDQLVVQLGHLYEQYMITKLNCFDRTYRSCQWKLNKKTIGKKKRRNVARYQHLVHRTVSDPTYGVTHRICEEEHTLRWPYFASSFEIFHSASVSHPIIASYYRLLNSHLNLALNPRFVSLITSRNRNKERICGERAKL